MTDIQELSEIFSSPVREPGLRIDRQAGACFYIIHLVTGDIAKITPRGNHRAHVMVNASMPYVVLRSELIHGDLQTGINQAFKTGTKVLAPEYLPYLTRGQH